MSVNLNFCSVPYLTRALSEVIPSQPSLENLKVAAEEAHRLAIDAFKLLKPSAQATAERMLHTIHTQSSFQSPLAPIPSLVWSSLMQAKMHHAFITSDTSVSRVMNADDLQVKLKHAVETMGAFNHPFLNDVAASKRSLSVYAKNWFGSIKGFTLQLGSLVQRSEGAVKLSVLNNLNDEFKGVPHCELRARFLAQAAPQYDNSQAIIDPDRVTSSFALSSFRTGVCLLSDPSYALGTFYAIEAHFPLECRRMLDILRRWGFEESTLEIFNLHATVDEHHAEEWLEVILSHVPPEAFDKVLLGAIVHQEHRRRMFDDMQKHTPEI